MNKFMFLCFFLSSIITYAQESFNYEHCNCQLEIAQVEPNLNGDFVRTCEGKIITTGHFINGLKDGKWITKSLNENIIRKLEYSNGILVNDVELFYSSGKKKLTGAFNNGVKHGKWTYYNEKGKPIKSGSFEDGSPIGEWKIFDLKGKKELVVYDFESKTYDKNNSSESIMEESAVLQDDNSAKWLIRQNHDWGINKFDFSPIEGYILSSDFHIQLMEIPYEIWETFVSYNFYANLKFTNSKLENVEVILSKGHPNGMPEVGFFAITNNLDKLVRVEHYRITEKLLKYSLQEAIWLMGPWIVNSAEVSVYVPYVINDFDNRKF